MTDKEAIKYLQQIYPNGGHCWLDEQRIEAIGMAVKALQEEPVSEDLEEAAEEYAHEQGLKQISGDWQSKEAVDFQADHGLYFNLDIINAFKAGANWKKEHLLKDAQSDDLPEIDKEVIALLDNSKVVYAHRPSEYWDGKNIDTGKVTRYYPKTYDKGGWNMPDVKYWLDVELPKEIEV